MSFSEVHSAPNMSLLGFLVSDGVVEFGCAERERCRNSLSSHGGFHASVEGQ